MKTGNSILAVFFFYMAFRIPVEVFNLSSAHDTPEVEGLKILSIILFGVCLALGCLSLEYGRGSKKTIDAKIPDKKINDVKIPSDKKITDLPDSLKNSISDGDKDVPVTDNHVVTNAVSEVDKDIPVFKGFNMRCSHKPQPIPGTKRFSFITGHWPEVCKKAFKFY